MDLIKTIVSYIPEALLFLALSWFVWSFKKYPQSPTIAFVRDDSIAVPVKSILQGQITPAHGEANKTKETKLGFLLDYASLCSDVYEELSNTEWFSERGWIELTSVYPRQPDKIIGRITYRVWYREEDKIVAIAFRGTVPKIFSVEAINSWIANGHKFFTYVPFVTTQYDRLKEILPILIKNIEEKVGKSVEIFATGHSLGGGLAQHAVYLSPKVTKAFVFNTSPVTGWTDIKNPSVRGSEIYRVYEYGEILAFGRLIVKIGYFVFNRRPNVDPYFMEIRLNLGVGGILTQHAIQKIAAKLKEIEKAQLDQGKDG